MAWCEILKRLYTPLHYVGSRGCLGPSLGAGPFFYFACSISWQRAKGRGKGGGLAQYLQMKIDYEGKNGRGGGGISLDTPWK